MNNPKSSLNIPSLLPFFFLLFHSTNAFNITKMLGDYPDFSSFNDYLTQTQLASEINSRRTITILVADNAATSSLSGKSDDMIKKIMSLHVVLDYYDMSKLEKSPNKTNILTTLFQASGQATGQQGFLNASKTNSDSVAIGSAVSGSSLNANLVKAVVAQPYNISVLQISSLVIPTGIENSKSNTSSATPPSKSPSPASSPAKSKAPSPSAAKTPAASPPKNSTGDAPSDAPASDDSSATPSDAPSSDASAPSDADAKAPAGTSAESPLGSPPLPSTASGPAADGADAPEGASSSGVGFGIHGVDVVVFMMVVSFSAWSLASMS